MVFSERLACAECGISFPEVSPRMFSFNSPTAPARSVAASARAGRSIPSGWCPTRPASLKAGALAPWAGARETTYFKQTLAVLAKRYKFSLDEPWAKLRKAARDVVLSATANGGFEGVVKVLEAGTGSPQSEDARGRDRVFMAERPCPACGGSRLRPESLGLKIGGAPSPRSCG